jgi:hypothetical protein
MKIRNNLFTIALVFFLVVSAGIGPGLCQANQTGEEPQTDANTAKLVIDGKFIISFVLVDENGRLTALGSPEDASVNRSAKESPKSIDTFIDIPAEGQAVSLAPGKYRVNTIKLFEPDKNLKFYSNNPIPESIELKANKTTTLKIGAPLRHVIKIGRQGGSLKLDYSLLGAAGENYRLMTDSSSSPTEVAKFTIYKGDKSIHSGSFRYG